MKEVFFVSKPIYLPVSSCFFQGALLLSIPSYAISFFLSGGSFIFDYKYICATPVL